MVLPWPLWLYFGTPPATPPALPAPRAPIVTRITDENRPAGYYWIVFDYRNNGSLARAPQWEPASWHPLMQAWTLLGTRDGWKSWQLNRIGYRITAPQSPPPKRSPDPQP